MGISTVLVMLVAASWPPIAQPDDYHGFADQRFLLGIPNFMNVISNLAILFSGVAGLLFLHRIQNVEYASNRKTFNTSTEMWPYLVFFISIVMTALGSAYYHWQPDNTTLLWDRLPIAIGVMALLAAVLVERVNVRTGLRMLPVLVLMGAASVIYWHWSEQQGAGNLNFYIVVQFYSLLLIVLLSWLLPSGYTHGDAFLKAIGLYALAKVAEMLDQQTFVIGYVVSGHTLKHLISGVAIWWIVRMLKKRSSSV